MRQLACALGCFMLTACETDITPADPSDAGLTSPGSRLEALHAPIASQGFDLALAPRAFEFPRDHGPHPEFRHEWWYFTGHLTAANTERFGFELTFFRYALAPPSQPVPRDSHWRAHQIYVAHFAVTDVTRGQFHSAERRDRDVLQLAGANAHPVRVWLRDWALDSAGTEWRLSAHDGPYALELVLQAVTAPVLNGEQGLSRKSAEPQAASYYYSIPRLTARGELERGAQRLDVAGTAWLDREWGSGSLAPDQQGWDWFALQLDDGSALMFYMLRKLTGARDPFSAGTWIEPNGVTRRLASQEVDVDVLDRWRSPRGGSYPARWRLRVPALGLDLELQPVLANQELDTTPRYWEGAVDVHGRRAGTPTTGRGYVELTGYEVASGVPTASPAVR